MKQLLIAGVLVCLVVVTLIIPAVVFCYWPLNDLAAWWLQAILWGCFSSGLVLFALHDWLLKKELRKGGGAR